MTFAYSQSHTATIWRDIAQHCIVLHIVLGPTCNYHPLMFSYANSIYSNDLGTLLNEPLNTLHAVICCKLSNRLQKSGRQPALYAHIAKCIGCLSMLLQSTPPRKLRASSEIKCYALTERCVTAMMGQRKDKWITQMKNEKNVHRARIVHWKKCTFDFPPSPNIIRLYHLLASRPKGTQSTTLAHLQTGGLD